MKRKFYFLLGLIALIPLLLVSCGKDDDEDAATVKITVINNGNPASGWMVYMFDSQTSSLLGLDRLFAKKEVATDGSGVATFDLSELDFAGSNSRTFYFAAFWEYTNGSDNNTYYNHAAITINKGETKGATINIGGSSSYEDELGYTYKKLTLPFEKNDDVNIIYGAINLSTQDVCDLNSSSVDIVMWYHKKNGFSLLSPDAEFLTNKFSDYLSTSKYTKFSNKGALPISSSNYKDYLKQYENKSITDSDKADKNVLTTGGLTAVGASNGTTMKLGDATFFETSVGKKGFVVLEAVYSNAVELSLYIIK